MGMYTEEGLKKPDGFMGLRSGLYRLVTITCIQGKDSNLKETIKGTVTSSEITGNRLLTLSQSKLDALLYY